MSSLESDRCRTSLERTPPIQADLRQIQLAGALREQRAEILAHRDYLARLYRKDISLDDAACDWIARYAESWRATRAPECP